MFRPSSNLAALADLGIRGCVSRAGFVDAERYSAPMIKDMLSHFPRLPLSAACSVRRTLRATMPWVPIPLLLFPLAAAAQFFPLSQGTPEETKVLNRQLGALVLSELPAIKWVGSWTGVKHATYLVEAEPVGSSICAVDLLTVSYSFLPPDPNNKRSDNPYYLMGVNVSDAYAIQPGLFSSQEAKEESRPCESAMNPDGHFRASGRKDAEQGVAMVRRALAKLDGAAGELVVQCSSGVTECADRIRLVRNKGLASISGECEDERPDIICAKVVVGYTDEEFWSGFKEVTLTIREQKSSEADPNPTTVVHVGERDRPAPPPTH